MLSPRQALLIPTAFAVGAAAPALIPSFRAHPVLFPTFLSAGGVLLVLAAAVYARTSGEGGVEFRLYPKTAHWIQALAQGSLMLYWGWHVRPVYGNLPFLLGQLAFAYGLDAIIQWWRHGSYRLAFGPIPIVVSINFFLWFKPEWYYWQFVIIALGFAAKEFVHWQRDGQSRHVFNPSSFPLSVFSLVLIVTGTTDATLGLEIAQTLFNPPDIYWAIFLVSLPAQILFGVTTMTVAAVATTYLWSLFYFDATGTFYFRDAYIPIAVFLGMHLLFTDPATSPRTEIGRVIFGMLYATFTIAFAAILEGIGAPTFYDKLLPIPILNTMVRRIDRVALAIGAWVPGALASAHAALGPVRHRLAVVALWVVTFLGMAAAGGVGDEHPGQYLPFWQEACGTGDERACEYVAVMKTTFCRFGSGWACNELGVQLAERERDVAGATRAFDRACRIGYRPGCDNVLRMVSGDQPFARGEPPLEELPIVVRGSKGPVEERSPAALYAMACERGWSDFCGR